MDFNFSEEQLAVRDLAAQIFSGRVDAERIKAIEATDNRIDRELWTDLAKANLLGIALDEAHGGSGLGLTALCLVLQEQGRRLAPVPLITVALGALPLQQFGTPEVAREWLPRIVEGQAILTAALDEADSIDPAAPRMRLENGALHGIKVAVPAGGVADRVFVPAATDEGVTVFVVDPRSPGVTIEPVDTTAHQATAHIRFDGVTPEAVLGKPGDGAAVVNWILERAQVALTAIQLGVAQEALRLTAEYASERFQFGKPLSTFQGVSLRAADAYIDTTAMDVTLWQAAWRIDEGLDASQEVAVAKWWAADGGQRVVYATQHLHGGMGADVDYPIHRYFLWGKQIADSLGGASLQLARLGAQIAESYR